MARLKTALAVPKVGERYRKLQDVGVKVAACSVKVKYRAGRGREEKGQTKQKETWLVQVTLEGLGREPRWLVADLPVRDQQSAIKVFPIYRQRWSIEDVFKFTKECLGWEEAQLLDLEGVRMLVALAWVAAAFLYEMGVHLDSEEVQMLGRLGGWEERRDRPPGRIVLARGLRRLLDAAAVDAVLNEEIGRKGQLPPFIAKLRGHRCPS